MKAELSSERIQTLQDDIGYWKAKVSDHCLLSNIMQCVDLSLDLETMKNLIDDEDDNLELEVDRLNKELKSVETSLKVLKTENAQLQSQIAEKSSTVNT